MVPISNVYSNNQPNDSYRYVRISVKMITANKRNTNVCITIFFNAVKLSIKPDSLIVKIVSRGLTIMVKNEIKMANSIPPYNPIILVLSY